MKLLITGSSGFIGTHTMESLKDNHTVIGYDRNVGRDILDTSTLHEHMKDIDVVIHLAALVNQAESWNKPQDYLITNGIGTFNVIQAAVAHQVKRVIFLSSAAVYAEKLTPYGLSKKFGEEACAMFQNDIEIVILRPFNIYGRGQNVMNNYAIHNFIQDIQEKGTVTLYGDGTQTREFLYIDDFVTVLSHALTAPLPHGPLDVGTGNPITINDLAKLIGKLLQKPFTINYLPKRQEPHASKADITRIQAWGISVTSFLPLEQGLQKLINI